MVTKFDTGRGLAFLRAALLAVCSVVSIAHAATGPSPAAPSPWGAVDKWVGHQATEALGAQGETLFSLAGVAEQLPRLLTPIKRARFDSYQATSRVQQVDHFLVAEKCNAAGCAAGNAIVILDRNSKNMWVVLKAHDSGEVQTCWIGTQHFNTLPQALQAPFVED